MRHAYFRTIRIAIVVPTYRIDRATYLLLFLDLVSVSIEP
jgi:hypothetical protein